MTYTTELGLPRRPKGAFASIIYSLTLSVCLSSIEPPTAVGGALLAAMGEALLAAVGEALLPSVGRATLRATKVPIQAPPLGVIEPPTLLLLLL